MSVDLILAMARMEVRLRMRRLGTVFALLAMIAITWSMIMDQKKGLSMMVVNGARTLYTSSALALGSATLSAMLIGLVGFYLVRGRMAEDMRSGIGGVIAATQVGNAQFLFGRWLGGVAYLSLLSIAVMATMLVRHAFTGVGPIHVWVYLQTYVLMLLPLIFFCTSCALLFDCFTPLMGKFGDVLYFFVWGVLIATLGNAGRAIDASGSPLLVVDFFGMCTTMMLMLHHFGTTMVTVGGGPFNSALAPRVLPEAIWWSELILYRGVCAMMALLPLLPAMVLFHRFSPDRVKASASNTRRSPLALLNRLLRPLASLVQPMFGLAMRLPGFAGQVLVELALSLVVSPLAILALLLIPAAALLAPVASLSAVLTFAAAVWAILIADLATRDYQADTEHLSGATISGVTGRYARQLAAAVLFGLLLMGMFALRWLISQPLIAAAVISGVFTLAAAASLFGRCTRTSRSFIALSLFWIYVALNVRDVAWIDLLGFNGVATWHTVLLQTVLGIVMALGGYGYHLRQTRIE